MDIFKKFVWVIKKYFQYTQSFYSGRQFDTLQVTCSHEFNKNWTYALSSGLADRTAWTTTVPPVTTTTPTVKTTTTTKQLLEDANKQFATETIQAFYPPINLKMASSASNNEDVEDIAEDEIKHYLEVINEDHSTTWGGRLHFKGLQGAPFCRRICGWWPRSHNHAFRYLQFCISCVLAPYSTL